MTGEHPAAASCLAAHSALRFSPNGEIHPCCVNDKWVLGRVGEATVAEVWSGPRIAQLRRALEAGDYSLGCSGCGDEHRLGNRLMTHAEQFDRFNGTVGAPRLRSIEFALSNTCNLQCVMCNGDLSSAIRAQREHRPPLRPAYDDEFFAEMAGVLDHLEVAVFIGGEPFLAREAKRMWDLMLDVGFSGEVHVTTNGTVWTDDVERYVHGLRMNVAVSIDAVTAERFEAIRPGAKYADVIRNRDRFLAATRSYGGSLTVNHCVMTENWVELGRLLLDADRIDVPVYSILVTHPARLSLLHLDARQLRAVHDTLTEEDAGIRHRLGRNRPVWVEMVERIRAQLALLEAGGAAAVVGVPVEITATPSPPPTPARIAALAAELQAWSGVVPLQIGLVDGRAVDLTCPPWAAPLDPMAFLGAAEDDLVQMYAPLGRPIASSDSMLEPGLVEALATIEGPVGTVRFRSFVCEWVDDQHRRRATILATTADADLIGATAFGPGPPTG